MTYRLSESEQEAFNSAINAISDDVEYVVLRNYTQLPQTVPGVDVDILCPPPHHQTIQDTFFDCKFERYTKNKSQKQKERINTIKEGIIDPARAARFIFSTPGEVYDRFFNYDDYEYYTGAEGFEMNKVQYENLEVDFYNHLAHPSPSNGRFYRIDPNVEQRMLANRKKYNGFYVPSPVDEFSHLICRGVFDHGGDFREYYVERCKNLYTDIKVNENLDELEDVFEMIFFDAVGVIMQCVKSGNYSQIRKRLKGYTGY